MSLLLHIPEPRPHARLRLVWFHHAGGTAASYRTWGRLLPESWELALAEYPGRGAAIDRAPEASIEAIAAQVAAALRACPGPPSAFFGHSMGALVAFEVARHVARGPAAPFWVGVSGRAGPPTSAGDAARLAFTPVLSDEALLGAAERLGVVARGAFDSDETRRKFLYALRADHAACDAYHVPASASIPMPLVGYAGLSDPIAPPAAVATWSARTASSFSVRAFPGGHFFLAEHRPKLLAALVTDVELAWSCLVPARRSA